MNEELLERIEASRSLEIANQRCGYGMSAGLSALLHYDIPALLAEVRRLQAENERLRATAAAEERDRVEEEPRRRW